MTDHSAALPWKLNRSHSQSGPATNLRNLSAAAQGKAVPKEKINTALRWASRLVENGLDIDYDPEKGFYEKEASAGSHVERVLRSAEEKLGQRVLSRMSTMLTRSFSTA